MGGGNLALSNKKQREIYVGNLTIGVVTDTMLRDLFNGALAHLVPDPVANPPVINAALDPSGDTSSSQHRLCFIFFPVGPGWRQACASCYDRVIGQQGCNDVSWLLLIPDLQSHLWQNIAGFNLLKQTQISMHGAIPSWHPILIVDV